MDERSRHDGTAWVCITLSGVRCAVHEPTPISERHLKCKLHVSRTVRGGRDDSKILCTDGISWKPELRRIRYVKDFPAKLRRNWVIADVKTEVFDENGIDIASPIGSHIR